MSRPTSLEKMLSPLNRFSLALCLVLGGSCLRSPAAVDFNRDIRPLLSDNCFHCHGPDAEHRKADLRLDQESGLNTDLGDGLRVVVPGEPGQSELITRIFHKDPDERMPPGDSGKTLSAEDKDLLKQWVREGAPWSGHWAYEKPQKQAPPKVHDSGWPLHWIDQFILHRLESEGLKPSPDANAVTLVRRLSFDLTGLPPTPGMVSQYQAEVRQDPERAYRQLVDRLLASPAFGERMAMYWLDLVRYADTVGYHGDQTHSISPYRDWVIQAFNDNMTLDQFTLEQLAGDLLANPSIDQKIATGYNRLLQTSHEGGVQAKEYLAIYAADRVRNFSGVWMGATVGCAQCHDHKYDPYSIRDFYSMVAFFADIDEAKHLSSGTNTLPTKRPPEISVLSRRQRREAAMLKTQIETLEKQIKEDTASPSEQASRKDRLKDLKDRLAALEKQRRQTMITVAIKPRTIRILPRGNWLDDSGPVVGPAIPEFMGKLDTRDRRPNRRDLAHWLVDTRHGAGLLTARVFANRFWYLLFGVGLSRSLDDFGGQGEPPVHPELLDRLAWEFVESGWDMKHLMREIALSRTYRQSSLEPRDLVERDPYNQLAGRQSRFRLPAEMIRDNALAVSGLLVRDMGGESIKPYQPEGYYRHLNFPTRKYEAHNDQRQWRRGVYMHWQRQFLHPMLKAMDAPGREECTAQRPRSNTPLAALTLLNDPTFVEAARVLAQRILTEGGNSDAARIAYAFQQVLSRPPDELERQTLGDFLKASRDHYAEREADARALVTTGLSKPRDIAPVRELAAWTSLGRALLNLNEVLTRN